MSLIAFVIQTTLITQREHFLNPCQNTIHHSLNTIAPHQLKSIYPKGIILSNNR